MANFDSSERANQIIEEEYSAVAYDEYLENYIQKSMDIVHVELQELCGDAKSSLENMIRVVDDYLDLSKDALDIFENLEFRKISEGIDNT